MIWCNTLETNSWMVVTHYNELGKGHLRTGFKRDPIYGFLVAGSTIFEEIQMACPNHEKLLQSQICDDLVQHTWNKFMDGLDSLQRIRQGAS